MSGLTELHLAPALAAALESFGYSAQDQAVRDQVPTAARGHNLALAWPPSARYAVPALAGVLSAQSTNGSRSLLLVPPHALAEWAAVVLPLAAAAGIPTQIAATPARATRRLREGGLGLLLTTPATALALLERSALKTDQLGHLILAWPEQFQADEALAALMQDLPAEAQRVVILAEPRPGHPLLERYARRCHLTGPLALSPEVETPARPPVRVVTTGWEQRGVALAGLLEVEDPASVTVWCVDRRSADEALAALPVGDPTVRVTTTEPPKASLIVAWDLPAPATLNQLRALGDLVLLAPPHAAPYLRQATSRQSPVRVPGVVEVARAEGARRRGAVQAVLTEGNLDGELLALAPLFERFDPAAVAAAVYRLWQSHSAEPVAQASETGGEPQAPCRLWVGCGRKDGATAADLVALLNREIGVAAGKIGRIEIRELFSLVEVPAGEAEQIARQLTGKVLRRRTLTAKVDKGRGTTAPRRQFSGG